MNGCGLRVDSLIINLPPLKKKKKKKKKRNKYADGIHIVIYIIKGNFDFFSPLSSLKSLMYSDEVTEY